MDCSNLVKSSPESLCISPEIRKERFPGNHLKSSPPPFGKISDPSTYGINLRIAGELISSCDVEVWEYPDIAKLKILREKLILFMEENRLKQVGRNVQLFVTLINQSVNQSIYISIS